MPTETTAPIRNQVQLITYPDSLGGDLKTLEALLSGPLSGLFGGIHLLPFFPSSADRGFSPVTYREVDPAFGDWEDIRRLGSRFDLITDLMVNHISRRSTYFQDFARRGRSSPYADMFITLDKVWPNGDPPEEDLERIFLRRPDNPFTDVTIEETGETERVWATFGGGVGFEGEPEQIDLDVHSPLVQQFIHDTLRHLKDQHIRIVRLDAVAYVNKKAGTSCFFVEPDLYNFLDDLYAYAGSLGLTLLPEVHIHYTLQARLADHGYWVYDFVLPFLVLHTLFTASSSILQAYLTHCPRKQITMLDCHDGIPVQPDMDGILTTAQSRAVVDRLVARGADVSPLHTREEHPSEGATGPVGTTGPGAATGSDFNAHQVDITYYSALDADDDAYLAARAIQFFAPGIPQVYYVGLLAGQNDHEAVARYGDYRAINRHNYTVGEVEAAVGKPDDPSSDQSAGHMVQSAGNVVQRLFRLIRFRNTFPAFDGTFAVRETPPDRLSLAWDHGDASCTLDVDLKTHRARITYQQGAGPRTTLDV